MGWYISRLYVVVVMTSEELKEVVEKFRAYLEANGVPVLCSAMYVGKGNYGEIVCTGGEEMLTEMLLIAVLHKRGWKVVPR